MDNPWQWEVEGKGGNRQDWLIVWVDVILWCGFYIYVKLNDIHMSTHIRLSSDTTEESYSSSEESDTV